MPVVARKFGWRPEIDGEHDALVGGPNRDASEDLLTGAPIIPSEASALVAALPVFKDQDVTNSCVAHAVANTAESSLRAISGQPVEASSIPALYCAANMLIEPPGSPLLDIGTYGRVLMHVAREWGVARDKDYPFRDPRTGRIIPGIVTKRVPPDVLQHASAWKLDEQLSINATGKARIDAVCLAITRLAGVPTAGVVDTAFMNYNGRGVLTAPKPGDVRGRHMVAIVAFRTNKTTKKREFCIRNSWSRWGLVWMNQPSLAWVDESWIHAQSELYWLRVSRKRRTS